MGSCCEDKSCALDALRENQGRTLRIVLAINATLFLGEFSAGLLAQSTALLADSLDALGDAMIYAFSLYVLFRSERWRVGAALLKGFIMLGFGIAVGWEALHKLLHPVVPLAGAMGLMGLLALLANASCLYLLARHRHDDLNMESVWLCSRNDIIANLGVLGAAAAVAATGAMWPDLLVGIVIAGIFLKSAIYVIVKSWRELAQTSS